MSDSTRDEDDPGGPVAWDWIDQLYREMWLMRQAFQAGANIAEGAGSHHVFQVPEKYAALIKQADRRKAAQLHQWYLDGLLRAGKYWEWWEATHAESGEEVAEGFKLPPPE